MASLRDQLHFGWPPAPKDGGAMHVLVALVLRRDTARDLHGLRKGRRPPQGRLTL